MLRRYVVPVLFGLVCLPWSGLSAQGADKPPAKPVAAVFTFGGETTEAPVAEDFPFGSVGESFHSLLTRLKKAKSDDSVKAVIMLVSSTSLGVSQIEEVRQLLEEIKASGKDVVAHADNVSMRSYVLLSGANRICVVPTGDIWINGMYGESMHLRGLLDLVGVEPDFTTCGDYKSAAEMFMRKSPSPAAQENLDWLMDGIFETQVNLISSGRKVDAAKVREWIDRGVYSAEAAKEAGIIDEVQFRQDFEAELKSKYGEELVFDKKYGKKKAGDIDLSSPFGVLKFYGELLSGPQKKKSSKAAVAIVYVEGPILPGASDPTGFPFSVGGVAYSTPIAKALDEAAADDMVKCVVLRVDSPGGSAVASEIILNATKRVQAKKPLVVSMGNVAGSGGYYVACGAKTIFADSSTITGSIGVVAGKLATSKMWDRVGINWTPIRRGANAGMLDSGDLFTDEQRTLLQSWMDEIYGVFKNHVVTIRGDKLTKNIDELAGGRVFTGQQALALGLVDKIGGLQDAIQFVAQEAGVEEYEIRVLPQPKSFIEMLMSDLQDGESDNKRLSLTLAQIAPQNIRLIDAVLPQLRALEPRRLQSVMEGLQQLQLLQQEGVLTAMPIIDIRD
ncbi:MAG: signal peptide peptidase SppA [Pirellulaceae bacterium]